MAGVNPNTFSYGGIGPSLQTNQAFRPSFSETLDATIGYTYDPVYEALHNKALYPQIDPNYDPWSDLENYEQYAGHLYSARNAGHMASLKRGIAESHDRRAVLANSTFMSQIGAGLFDPLNLIMLPLGGPTIGIGRSALRVGTGTAIIQGSIEAGLIQPFDPVQSAGESTLNTAGAFLFGGALGGLFSVPMTNRARVYENITNAMEEQTQLLRRVEYAHELTAEDFSTLGNARGRQHSDLTDTEIADEITRLYSQRQAVEAQGDTALDALEAIDGSLSSYKREFAMRRLEDEGISKDGMFDMANNVFTDSVFFRMVSTPFKRVMQSSKYPTMLKEAMVKTGGDSALNSVMNTLGIASPQSVYQRAVKRNGDWVRAHDELVAMFREDKNMLDTSIMDVDVVNAYREKFDKPNSYGAWLQEINRKRQFGERDQANELELRGMTVLDNFFQKAQRELNDAGLIGDMKSLEVSLRTVEKDLQKLNIEIDAIRASRPARGLNTRDARTERRRLVRLLNLKRNRRSHLIRREREIKDEMTAWKEEQKAYVVDEAFLPRFWNMSEIKKRRNELELILVDWFTQNPYIYKTMADGSSRRVKLSESPEDIASRAKASVDGILGDKDPTNVDNIGFGYGRSKHFRHRKLDIPNHLVWDFMIKDPIAIMKTYTARVAPRLEFKKMFGMELGDLKYKLNVEMMDKGLSESDINKGMRDYQIIYDRIAGAVLEEPHAMNQKIAYVMKEAASMNYMGGAWTAALPEFGRVMMEHEASTLIKATQGMLNSTTRRLSNRDARLSGATIDILQGTAHARMVDDMANNVDANEAWAQARNVFYLANGLAPITTITKMWDGLARSHTIIERSIAVRNGTATQFEVTYLARHGINKQTAIRIAEAPWEMEANGLIVANSEEWLNNFRNPDPDRPVTYGNTDSFDLAGVYRPVVIKEDSITIDMQWFKDGFEMRPWMNGDNPLPEQTFATPQEYANFWAFKEIARAKRMAEVEADPRTKLYEGGLKPLTPSMKSRIKKQDLGTRNFLEVYSDEELFFMYQHLAVKTHNLTKNSWELKKLTRDQEIKVENSADEIEFFERSMRGEGYSDEDILTFKQFLRVSDEHNRRFGNDNTTIAYSDIVSERTIGPDVDTVTQGTRIGVDEVDAMNAEMELRMELATLTSDIFKTDIKMRQTSQVDQVLRLEQELIRLKREKAVTVDDYTVYSEGLELDIDTTGLYQTGGIVIDANSIMLRDKLLELARLRKEVDDFYKNNALTATSDDELNSLTVGMLDSRMQLKAEILNVSVSTAKAFEFLKVRMSFISNRNKKVKLSDLDATELRLLEDIAQEHSDLFRMTQAERNALDQNGGYDSNGDFIGTVDEILEDTNERLLGIIEAMERRNLAADRLKPKEAASTSLFDMSADELLGLWGERFNIEKLITDPAEIAQFKADQVMLGGDDFDGVLGWHVYETDGSGANGKGTVYMDLHTIAAHWRDYVSKFRDPAEVEYTRNNLEEAKRQGFDPNADDEGGWWHSLHTIENMDLHRTADEFAEYILYHELSHGSHRQRDLGETTARLEGRVDRLGLAAMRARRLRYDAEEGLLNRNAMKRLRDQQATSQETVDAFRSAINTGILNTIMSATPADRPIINDGLVFVPFHIAKKFGYKEDPKYQGYSRIENGFLALPFQFYSYTLANVNKMVGGMAHGQMKNKTLGLTTMLGLGYLAVMMKTPDYVWDKMNWRDRFARSYDASGITALYSDLFYTSMHTSLALGGPNITNGIVNPKYPVQRSNLDAATGLLGAGPSISADLGRGIFDFANGNYGEGASQVARNLPFARMWFWKDEMNQVTRSWGN